MGGAGLIAALAGAIVAILAGRAVWVLRHERDGLRGSPPGKGDHVLRSEYFSGLGGGETREYKVPKDPQAYARLFVPKPKHKP